MNIPSILDNIIHMVKAKKDSVLGIDLGSSSIKIVQVRKKNGQAVLETYGEIALGPYADTDIGRAVKLRPDQALVAINDVLKESNATTKIAGVSIPLTSSLITTMKVPKIDGANLEEIVTMEARRYIPVSMEEITLDWQVIPDVSEASRPAESGGAPPGAQSANILIVAVHTEAIENIKKLTESAHIDSKFFELEAFSTIRAVIAGDRRTVAVVDFGASSTKVFIVSGGVIKLSHTIPFGSQDTTLSISRSIGIPVAEAERRKRQSGGEDIMETNLKNVVEVSASFVATEISKIIKGYQIKNSTTVEEVIFSGGGIAFKGMHEFINRKIGIKSRIADPFANLMAPAFLSGVLKEIGPTFAVAIGAAMRAVSDG
jgi:type IV pilus assembly protein PilM